MAEIGTAALKPNERLEPLARFVGEWRTEGRHELMPGVTLTGRTSVAWHLGGAFLLLRSEIDDPQVPDGVALIGSDDDGTLTLIYFDERGVSRRYDVFVDDGVMEWRRDDAELAQVMRFIPEEDGFRLEGRASEKGGVWRDDLMLTYRPAE